MNFKLKFKIEPKQPHKEVCLTQRTTTTVFDEKELRYVFRQREKRQKKENMALAA